MLAEEDIIEQAIQKYPVGTKVRSVAYDWIKDFIKSHDYTRFSYSDNHNEIWFSGETYGLLIYKDGIWAEIIKPAVIDLNNFVDSLEENINAYESRMNRPAEL